MTRSRRYWGLVVVVRWSLACAGVLPQSKKRGVHNVHTLGVGLGRTGGGSGRMPMFPGVPSVCKGRNPVRVPPRARMTPRQRGFCFNVWTLTLPRVPLTLSAGCAWRRGGLFGCVGGGVRVLAGGPSACWNLGYVSSFLAVSGGQLLAVTRSWSEVVVTT